MQTHKPTREIGVAFKPSSSKSAFVVYTLQITCEIQGPGPATVEGTVSLLSDDQETPSLSHGSVSLSRTANPPEGETDSTTTILQLSSTIQPNNWVLLTASGGATITLVDATEVV